MVSTIMEENNELETRLVEREEAIEIENEKSLVRRSWEESRLIWRTAFPAVLFRLSVFGVQVVTQSFIGHISQVELAAYSLVQSISVKFANGVLVRVAIGTGSQTKVAYVNIISYYLIGIPIGCVLAYVADYGITGIWIGLICGIVTQGIFLAYVTLRIDWTIEIDRATQRLNRYNLDRDQKGNANSSAS
ncbi:hypothetical protein V2J09_012394 [Rumex salicifolius]